MQIFSALFVPVFKQPLKQKPPQTKASGLFAKDKHAKEFVLAMRLMHHVIKKNVDNALFSEFGSQFEAFKKSVKAKLGCDCGCSCDSK